MSKIPHGEPYAGNPHVRFDEGAGVPDKGRTALLYPPLGVSLVYWPFKQRVSCKTYLLVSRKVR